MFLLPLLLACGGEVEKDTVGPADRPDLSDQDSLPDDGETTPDDGDTTDGEATGDDPVDDPDPQDTGEVGEEDPGEYIYEEDDQPGGDDLLSLGEIEQGLFDVFDALTWMDPGLFHDTFDSLQALGDGTCPAYTYTLDEDGVDYWYDYCTATTGTAFYGYFYGYFYTPYTDGFYVYDDLSYFQGDARMVDADGNTMEASGYAYYQDYVYTYSGTRSTYGYLYGDFRWDGPGSEGTWLASELSMGLDVSSSYVIATGSRNVSFSGSFSGIDGVVDSAYLDDFILFDAAAGSDCEIEPAGTVSVRDDSGNWYDVEFQGSPYWGASVFPLDCDGCGQVYQRGDHLGDVCPDITPLQTWVNSPWESGDSSW